MIFLLMVLVIMVFAVLWNFDVHKILHIKSKTQNAGDAAALMAARWQGITLNLIGDLNIMQAIAISDGDAFALGAITNMQTRLCFTGPMIALEASQQAAKNNGIYRNESFTARLRRHAQAVREEYPYATDESGEMLFPEPYTGCWEEYANMLDAVANNGVAAGPDNAHLYTDRPYSHPLLNYYFYHAVAGQIWCWFFHHEYDLLKDYNDYHDWDPLPEMLPDRQYMNSEIFGLGLMTEYTTLASMNDDPMAFYNFLNGLAADRELGTITTNAMETNALWFCYHENSWQDWDVMKATGSDHFPLTGPVKDTFYYTGADSASRVTATKLTLVTPDQQTPNIVWTAAAKPFGYLGDDLRPDSYGLVLPAFRQTALIPLDASSCPAGGAYDIDWREHIEQHLDEYIEHGTSALEPGCYYCNQLETWEMDPFREAGVDWLSTNSYQCTLHYPGGHGGGTQRGH